MAGKPVRERCAAEITAALRDVAAGRVTWDTLQLAHETYVDVLRIGSAPAPVFADIALKDGLIAPRDGDVAELTDAGRAHLAGGN
jgi:hypothetical protein